LTQDTLHDEAVFQAIASLRLERIDDTASAGAVSSSSTSSSRVRKVLDGTDSGENVGVSAPLNQLFELLPGPSRTEGDAQPLFVPSRFSPVVGLLAGGRDANRWKAMAPSEKTSEASVTLRTSEMASGRHVNKRLRLDKILDHRGRGVVEVLSRTPTCQL